MRNRLDRWVKAGYLLLQDDLHTPNRSILVMTAVEQRCWCVTKPREGRRSKAYTVQRGSALDHFIINMAWPSFDYPSTTATELHRWPYELLLMNSSYVKSHNCWLENKVLVHFRHLERVGCLSWVSKKGLCAAIITWWRLSADRWWRLSVDRWWRFSVDGLTWVGARDTCVSKKCMGNKDLKGSKTSWAGRHSFSAKEFYHRYGRRLKLYTSSGIRLT